MFSGSKEIHIVLKWVKEDKTIRGALRDLVPFVQFKKREKHPWRGVNFSKIAGFSTTYEAMFSISIIS